MIPPEVADCPENDITHQNWQRGDSFADRSANLSENELPWVRTHLKIPREDRTVFARPALAEAPQLAESNRRLLEHAEVDVLGLPLGELRKDARREVFELAKRYTQELTGQTPFASLENETWICSGHQPELFHPGVWIKNFAIHSIAKTVGGRAMNIVVDNDVLESPSIKVPVGTRDKPSVETIAFDDPHPSQPWEEARLQNSDAFQSFGGRVEHAMKEWNITPLAGEFWPKCVASSETSGSLRDAFTEARAKTEQQWQAGNLEVPLSQICETDSFRWFASAILTRLPRFRKTYNEILQEFREVNHIRSQTRPVPALTEEDGWIEAPFWVWRAGDDTRRRVAAKACSKEVRLSDGETIFARLPISPDGLEAAVEVLAKLPAQGIRFRTRALTTTLFARLCLADLFIHGIGGAKYDEMTDRLISRFFGLKAPEFLAMSCTVHLPLGTPFDVSPEEENRLKHQLRDLKWNPERHISPDADEAVAALIAEKCKLIAEQNRARSEEQTAAHRRENYHRHARLKEITAELQKYTNELREMMEAERKSIQKKLRANHILTNREFSLLLYPAEKLREFLVSAVSIFE